MKSSHQRQVSQGTPTTTTTWTRSQAAAEFSSPLNGKNNTHAQLLLNRNASGSKDRVREGIDEVKEGMQHLIKAINSRCKEITEKQNDHIINVNQHDKRQDCKGQKVSTTQRKQDNYRRRLCNQEDNENKNNNLYDFSSDSDIVQTIVSDDSCYDRDDDIQSRQQIQESGQGNQQDSKQAKEKQYQWDIPPNHSSNAVHSSSNNTLQGVITEAESLLNSIKLNKKAFASFLRMFGSEQAFYSYLSQPDSQNSTALVKIMGLLQDLLQNQLKSHTSIPEKNFSTMPILTQHSLPSQWSSMTPKNATGIQYPQRPASPMSSFPSPPISAEKMDNNTTGNALNQVFQGTHKVNSIDKDQSFRQQESFQGGNSYSQNGPIQMKELSDKRSSQRAQIVSNSQSFSSQSFLQRMQQNQFRNQPSCLGQAAPYQINNAGIQDQLQIQQKWQQQVNRRGNQFDLNLSSHRQQRSQVLESSQHLANSQLCQSSSTINKSKNNQLSMLNQSSSGNQNPPMIRVEQLAGRFEESFQNVNSGKQQMQKLEQTLQATDLRNGQSSFQLNDVQSQLRLANQQSLNRSPLPNSSVSADKNNNSNRWSFSNQLYAAVPQEESSKSDNKRYPQQDNDGGDLRRIEEKGSFSVNPPSQVQVDNNSFMTNRVSNNQLGQTTGNIYNAEGLNNTKSRQAASVDSAVAQAALQTLNQFFNNQGDRSNEAVSGMGCYELQDQEQGKSQEHQNHHPSSSLTYNALQSRNKAEEHRSRGTQSCNQYKNSNSNFYEKIEGSFGCSDAGQNMNLGFEQLPERNSMGQEGQTMNPTQGVQINAGLSQSWVNNQVSSRISQNSKDIGNLSLSGRSIPNISRANSARPLDRQGGMMLLSTDRIIEGTRQVCGLSSERTREVAGELRELKQREALLKMYEYGGEITGLEGRLDALKRRVNEENRRKEELARAKYIREQLERERLRLEMEAAERRRKEEMEMKKREQEMAEEMRLRRQEEEYYKRMNEIRIAEERIQREKEAEIRRKRELEEEDRKRKAEILEQERLLREEKQAYLLQRQAEQEELDRIRQLEEAQILARKREMEAELERVRQKEEEERIRRVKQEEEQRQQRQRQLEIDEQRRQMKLEREERERMEKEEKERQARLLEAAEEMERKRQEQEAEEMERKRLEEEAAERQRQEMLRQQELERKNRKLQEELNSNYMKATEARVNYVRSVHKEYLRRSNTTLIEAAQCSPSRKQTQIITNASAINPKWEKVLSKFTNGELKDTNEEEKKKEGDNEEQGQGSHRQLDGVQRKGDDGEEEQQLRSENVSPLLGKKNIKESSCLATPRSAKNTNNGYYALEGSQINDQQKECQAQTKEEQVDDNYNYKDQTFESAVQDINRRSQDECVLMKQLDLKQVQERFTEIQMGKDSADNNRQNERSVQIEIQQEKNGKESFNKNNKTNESTFPQYNQQVSYNPAQLQFPRLVLQDGASPSRKSKESARQNSTNTTSNLTKSPMQQPAQMQSLQKHLLRSKSSADTQLLTQSCMKSPSNKKPAVQASSDQLKLVLKKSNNDGTSSPSGNCTPTVMKHTQSSEITKGRDGSARRIKLNDNSNSSNGDIQKKPALVRKKDKSKTLVAFGATLPLKSALKTSFASVIATVMNKGIHHHAAFKEEVAEKKNELTAG